MISVRMSEEEFSTLRRMCVATGARSLSDMARANQETATDATKNEYHTQMKDLEQKVERLSAEVALFKANRQP
jgi:hypothetical protein